MQHGSVDFESVCDEPDKVNTHLRCNDQRMMVCAGSFWYYVGDGISRHDSATRVERPIVPSSRWSQQRHSNFPARVANVLPQESRESSNSPQSSSAGRKEGCTRRQTSAVFSQKSASGNDNTPRPGSPLGTRDRRNESL